MGIRQVLEFTVISGEDLRTIRGEPVEKNAYVIIGTDDGKSDMTATNEEVVGSGGCPSWDDRFFVGVARHVRSLTAEVRVETDGDGGGSELVGTGNIPVSEIFDGPVPEKELRVLSFRLRDPSGERNGKVNVSVRYFKGRLPGTKSIVRKLFPTIPIPLPRKKVAGAPIGGGIVTGMCRLMIACIDYFIFLVEKAGVIKKKVWSNHN